jgi:hypothetical protein
VFSHAAGMFLLAGCERWGGRAATTRN